MPEPQTFKNHARVDPPWHFFVLPLALINLIVSIVLAVHYWPTHGGLAVWYVAISLGLAVSVVKIRTNSLKVQDRLIRLEERLRFAALLPTDELARTHSLTVAQIVALRFASDAELPALVKRTLAENLEPKQIKAAIQDWRPDYLRV